AATLSPSSICKRYRSSYETPSPLSSSDLPSQKRYLGKSMLVKDTEDECSDLDIDGEGLQDEGPSSEEEEKRLHLRVSSSYHPSGITIDSTIMAKIFLAELGVLVGLQGGLLHDHAQHLDILPPTLFKEQERATVTFSAICRPVLALDSCVGHVDAQRAMMWQEDMMIIVIQVAISYPYSEKLMVRRNIVKSQGNSVIIVTPDRDIVKQNLMKDYRTVETGEKPTVSTDHDLLTH
nr:hypothetical protein [Tanacetum cinerariifolium]